MRVLLLFFLVFTLFADDLKDYYKLKSISIYDKACVDEGGRYCFKRKLSYPNIELLNKKKVESLIDFINKSKDKFYEDSAKSFIKDIKEEDFIGGSWYEDISVSLYNYIDGFLTIKRNYESYTGGAHGTYGIEFFVYYKNKELKLKDILGKNEDKFINLALEVYKEQKGLMPSESLENDGWFDNNFTLTENFALNDDEIVFLYNIYEIKAYASGITTFTVPYYRLKNILDESSAIYNLVRKAKVKNILKKEIAIKGGKVEIIVDRKRREVEAKLSLNKEYKKLWLSISIPNLTNKNDIKLTDNLNFKSYKAYDTKDKIYNQELKKAVKAKYLLVEAYAKDFRDYDEYAITFKIKKPVKKIYLNIRVTAKEKGKVINLIEDEDTIIDQQAFEAKRVVFYLF